MGKNDKKISEDIMTCSVCKKQHKRHETDKYVYHSSVGVVCIDHKGVKEWYEKLLKEVVS